MNKDSQSSATIHDYICPCFCLISVDPQAPLFSHCPAGSSSEYPDSRSTSLFTPASADAWSTWAWSDDYEPKPDVTSCSPVTGSGFTVRLYDVVCEAIWDSAIFQKCALGVTGMMYSYKVRYSESLLLYSESLN